MRESLVEVLRGAVVESRHRIHGAIVDAAGRLRCSAGDPDLLTFARSAAKPFQAIPVVSEGAMDRFDIAPDELALICGSHSGEPVHVETVVRILKRIGLDAAALACGPHPPINRAAQRELAEAGLEPGKLHNNCSGKHAGMLAVARVHGWETAGYERAGHPVQGRILAEFERWLGLPAEAMAMGVDGCTAMTVGVPLRNLALGYARLARAARAGEPGSTPVVTAMTSHPRMVAGSGRLCTDLMTLAEGRLFAKIGAEGVYCVGVPGAELGIAIKVEDGAQRALSPAILAILRELDLISEDDLGQLLKHAYPEVRNTQGEVVGEVRARVELRPRN